MSEHVGSVMNGFASAYWDAECSCGWGSYTLPDDATARERLAEHYDAVKEETAG